MDDKKRQLFRPRAAASIVIANMVGTGVFTSLGFQLADIQSGFVLMMLWAIGGVIAFCGAMSYAELGAALPRSGGEYNFLGEIYHPAAGFVSGWVSATVGFAGPTALAAITFATYLGSAFPAVPQTPAAVALVAILTLVHATNRNASGNVQVAFTALKIALIIIFCALAFVLVPEPQSVTFAPQTGDLALMTGGAFAVSLIYVSYAYTGWNVATYLSAELENPQRNLPLVLGAGTLLVIVLYLALNYIFLYVAPIDDMVGKVEIGYIAADNAFGDIGAKVMGVVLALLLISTVSAMIIAGPRVYQAIGQDYAVFAWLARTNRYGVPAMAIYLQGVITITFILTSPFEYILLFSGFTLALNTFAAVAGLFVLRVTQPELLRPFKAWGYPITPLIFLGLTGWTLWYVLIDDSQGTLFGLGAGELGLVVIGIGLCFYALTEWLGGVRARRLSIDSSD
ncbi:MAG: amino acid permease [Pseudomonadota bacterium]